MNSMFTKSLCSENISQSRSYTLISNNYSNTNVRYKNILIFDFLDKKSQEDDLYISNLQYVEKYSNDTKIENDDKHIDEFLLNKAFDNVIKRLMKKGNKPKSVLLGTASAFLKSSKDLNVDTFLLMGISMVESAYGTSSLALKNNNLGGLCKADGKTGIHCKSIESSIQTSAKVLSNNSRWKTINGVALNGNYCCAGAASLRQKWANDTLFFANKIIAEYNQLVAKQKLAPRG